VQRAGLTGGREIAFESNRDGDWEIYLIDVADQRDVQPHAQSRGRPFAQLVAGWQPDQFSHRIANPTGRMPTSWTRNGGPDLRRVSSGQGIYRDPSWTADGKTLALMHGFGQLFLVDASSGEERWIALGFARSFRPTGARCSFYAEAAARSIRTSLRARHGGRTR